MIQLSFLCANIMCTSQLFSQNSRQDTQTLTNAVLLSFQCEREPTAACVETSFEPRLAPAESPVEDLLHLFDEYLNNSSSLQRSSIDTTLRILKDILKYSFQGKGEEELSAETLSTVFSSLGVGESFLNSRCGTLRHLLRQNCQGVLQSSAIYERS